MEKTRKGAHVLTQIKAHILAAKSFYTRDYLPTGNRLVDFLLRNRYELTLLLLFGVLNLLLAIPMQYPLLTDEHITIAEGVYLWGGADNWPGAYSGGNYYGYGYSILYGFVYNLTQDMRLVFQWSLVLNSLVAACVPVLAYRIAHTFLHVRRLVSMGIALLAGVYPAVVVYAKYALNETILFLLPLLAIYILLYLYNGRVTTGQGIALHMLLGFLCMYAYTVHGRGVALFGTVFVCVVFLAIRGKKPLHWLHVLLFLGVAALWYWVDSLIKSYLLGNFFQAAAGEAGNTVERVLNVNMAGAFSSLPSMLGGFFGQVFYMMCATCGLLCVFGGALFRLLRHLRGADGRTRALTFVFVFTALFALASIFISTMFLSGIYVTEELRRTEYYMYGRYNEAACLLILCCAVAYIAIRRPGRRFVLTALGVAAAVVVAGAAYVAPRVAAAGGSLSYSMVPAVLPFMGYEAWVEAGPQNFAALAVAVVAILCVGAVLLLRKKTAWALLLLAGVSVYSFSYTLGAFVYPLSEKRYTMVEDFQTFSTDIAHLAKEYPRVYVAYFSPPELGLQFAMPQFRMQFLNRPDYGNSELADVQPNSLIVAKHDELMDELYSDVYEVGAGGRTHVWAYGDALCAALEVEGYELWQDKLVDRNSYTGSELQVDALGYVEGESVVLEPDGVQFGPYRDVSPGRYVVNIYGENLTAGQYAVQYAGGEMQRGITEFREFTPEHVSYSYTFTGAAEMVEFCAANGSGERMRIDTMSVKLYQPPARIPLAEAGGYVDLCRDMMLGGSGLYSGGNFTFTGSVKGQTGLLMRPGGEMELGGLYLNPGTHRLTVRGTGIGRAEIRITGEQQVHATVLETADDRVVMELRVDSHVREGVLHIRNASTQDMVYRGISIYVQELMDTPAAQEPLA